MFGLILDLALGWLLVLMAVAAVALARRGETARRLVIADVSVLLVVGALVLTAMRSAEAYYLDAALALSLLSFVSSIVIAAFAAGRVARGGSG